MYPNINIVDKHPIKEFSAIQMEGGVITLCVKNEGAFLTISYLEDLENLKSLLNKLTIINGYVEE
jgi:hypothetical protein